jgi:hypothetical protein
MMKADQPNDPPSYGGEMLYGVGDNGHRCCFCGGKFANMAVGETFSTCANCFDFYEGALVSGGPHHLAAMRDEYFRRASNALSYYLGEPLELVERPRESWEVAMSAVQANGELWIELRKAKSELTVVQGLAGKYQEALHRLARHPGVHEQMVIGASLVSAVDVALELLERFARGLPWPADEVEIVAKALLEQSIAAFGEAPPASPLSHWDACPADTKESFRSKARALVQAGR